MYLSPNESVLLRNYKYTFSKPIKFIFIVFFFGIRKKFSRLEAENFLLKCFGSKKPKIRAKTFISDVNLSFLVSLS